MGTVISIDETYLKRDGRFSIIEFIAYDGKRHTFEDTVQTPLPIHHIGEQVKVLYDPRNPNVARISTPFRNYGIPLVLFLLGFMFIYAVRNDLFRFLKSLF